MILKQGSIKAVNHFKTTKNMTPKEKAHEMIGNLRFALEGLVSPHICKLIATYTCSQIIASNPHSNPLNSVVTSTMSYWLEVKKEIEKF